MGLVGVACGTALIIAVGRVGFLALLVWCIAEGVLFPFLRYPSLHPYVTFDRAALVGLVGVFAWGVPRLSLSRQSRVLVVALSVLVAVFGVRALTTVGGTIGPVATWIDAIALPFVAFLTTRALASSPSRVIAVTCAVATGGTITALIALAGKIFGFELASRSGAVAKFDTAVGVVRISGPYPYPEILGLVLCCTMAATAVWMLAAGRRAYVVGLVALGLQLLAASLTLFRATWISELLVVLTAFGIRPRRFRRTVVLGAVLVVGVLLFSGPLEGNRVFETRLHNGSNVQSRFATYRQGIDVWETSPLIGVGVNNYTAIADSLPTVYVRGVESLPYPHSSFVAMLSEQGLIGLLALSFAVFAAWRLLRAHRRAATERHDILLAAGVVGAAAAYLISSLTLTMISDGPSNAMMLVLLGLVSARLDAIRAGGVNTA